MSAPVTLKQGKIRRPAVARLAALLQRENPRWSEEECVTRAKSQVTSTHMRVMGVDGIVREVKRAAS